MDNDQLSCSFCGKKKEDTKLLIAGLDAHICDRCIEQAYGIVLEEAQDQTTVISPQDVILRKPKQIKSFLDDYVIGQEYTKRVLSVARSSSKSSSASRLNLIMCASILV